MRKDEKRMITCNVGGHEYTTEKLYFRDFTELGFITEEKVYPFLTCVFACIANDLADGELLKALYTSCKDIFNRDDLKKLSELALNKEHLRVDGKQLDNAEWEKHWQDVGFADYRVVCFNFIRENLGNFSSLSALLPGGAMEKMKSQIEKKLLTLLVGVSEILTNSEQEQNKK